MRKRNEIIQEITGLAWNRFAHWRKVPTLVRVCANGPYWPEGRAGGVLNEVTILASQVLEEKQQEDGYMWYDVTSLRVTGS